VEQLVQLEDADEEYVPTKQDEHTVAEAAEYLPAAQVPVTEVRPVVTQYDPAIQAVQELAPVDAM